ncbi:metallophosphatase domain-containing protein [Oscillochloris sp. ZM17-4]|uniref:metallophosphatase domain-containing protein n=1 Tax=Oscillochloris sp. ZM17-4 TaxID=2866714 RepID=UPI001C732C01|nr:metallophosphatase domain-containing protein [Oscillochloris sp. ZM17-4]MBX0330508.1 metallophosphatase domain-containing protein [Oscillochloris sp. ZM17-4]
MRIVAISDTHGLHRQIRVPPGDILIHAGDLTRHGDRDALADVNAWLAELPHRQKLVIAGNHDWCLYDEPEAARALLISATYLCDERVAIQGVQIYGSPWTPSMGWAFSRSPMALQYHWAELPDGIDVLITHGPPLGALDQDAKSQHCGDAALAAAVRELRPRLHI